ncbi:MAG TPA: hypothetical protein VM469_03715 [Pseudoxanthomonas sp.]|nr:hypothetical protein [Pseudoxanthomonas sp.]
MSAQAWLLLGVQISILATVFCFGLQATPHDALHLLRHRSLFLRSLLSMFVAMPVAALLIVGLFELSKPTEIVLVALAISPIPPLLPRKEGNAGGHAAFALALMFTMALLAIVIVPLASQILSYCFDRPFAMNAWAVAKVVLLMIAAPLLAGMAVRAWWPAVVPVLLRPLKIIATVLLVVSVLVIIVAMTPTLVKLARDGTLLALLAFVLIGLIAGHWLGGPVSQERSVLALSTASRHPAIALAIAKGNFPDEPYLAATIVLYLLVATVVAVPYVKWRRRSQA